MARVTGWENTCWPVESDYSSIGRIRDFVTMKIHLYRPQGEDNVFTGVCPQSASWLLVHCSALLQWFRYASYWNTFLFRSIIISCKLPLTVTIKLTSLIMIFLYKCYFVTPRHEPTCEASSRCDVSWIYLGKMRSMHRVCCYSHLELCVIHGNKVKANLVIFFAILL